MIRVLAGLVSPEASLRGLQRWPPHCVLTVFVLHVRTYTHTKYRTQGENLIHFQREILGDLSAFPSRLSRRDHPISITLRTCNSLPSSNHTCVLLCKLLI